MGVIERVEGRASRHHRIRRVVRGSVERPRLVVYRSLKHIYAQVVNDDRGVTVVSAGSLSPELKDTLRSGGNVAAAKEGYAAVRNEAAKAGRDPDQMFLCNLTTPVCGATKAEAEDKMAVINKLTLQIDALSLLAEALN